jgi:hypothetical protein
MKITEIVGSVADQEHEAARISFMQRIANAFTRGGRVKGPLDFQGSEDPATSTAVPYSYLPTSEEGTSTVPGTHAVQKTGTIAPTLAQPRAQFRSPSTARGRDRAVLVLGSDISRDSG